MDKLSLISGALFLAADIFAVAALAMPDWIVTEVGGDTRLGLMQVLSLPGTNIVEQNCNFQGH